MKHQSIFAATASLALLVACSSAATGSGSSGDSTSGGSSGSSGTSGNGTSGNPPVPPSGTSGAPPGVDSGSTDGGFDFTFTNAGANTSLTELKVAPVYGAQCQGQAPNRSCSFVGTQNANGCTGILGAAFVGTPTVGMSYPIVVTPTTPPGNAEVSYTEVCGQIQKMWKATGGTLNLDKYAPPSSGMGTASFTLVGATLEPESTNPGDAKGNFSVSGKASNVQYSAAN